MNKLLAAFLLLISVLSLTNEFKQVTPIQSVLGEQSITRSPAIVPE
jgi:hypothetical protein